MIGSELYANTPIVKVFDPRRLVVREIEYWRHPDTPALTEVRASHHVYDKRGFLAESADLRLQAAGQANFRYVAGLNNIRLRTQSVDAGVTIKLDDVAGRSLLVMSQLEGAQDGSVRFDHAVSYAWKYERSPSPGRLVGISEQIAGGHVRKIEHFVYAGNSQQDKDLNLVGRRSHHYDTAGLLQTDSLALTGIALSSTRRLIKDAGDRETVIDWQGDDPSVWDDLLCTESYVTLTTADPTGVALATQDAAGHQQGVAYDVAGMLAGSWLTFEGRHKQVVLASLAYSAAGQKLRELHGNGVETHYTYAPRTQRLEGTTAVRPGDKVLQDQHYTYDPAGNVLNVRNDAEDIRFWRNQRVVPENVYEYDSLYQLVRARGREMANACPQGSQLPDVTVPLPTDSSAYTNYTRTYHYDGSGNLTRIHHRASATGNEYALNITVSDRSNRGVTNRLTDKPSEVDAWFTPGGSQRQLQPGQSLAWTSRGELLQVRVVDRDGRASDTETYRYGADKRRVIKVGAWSTSGGVQRQQAIYLQGLELRTTANKDRNTEHLHVAIVGRAGQAQVRGLHWETGLPGGVINDQLRYRYDDPVGSSSLEVDGDGNRISQEEYYPYGGTAIWAARSQVEAKYKTVRYSGKECDATGLYYYGHRYYQPWVGRWLSADPLGTVDGLNLYRMAGNNPVTFTDLAGLVLYPRTPISGTELYQPKISTGKDRDRAGAESYPPRGVEKIAELDAVPVRLEEALREQSLVRTPLFTGLFDPTKVPVDKNSGSILSGKSGGILAIGAVRIDLGGDEHAHALRVVDSKTSNYQAGAGAEFAYWAPQGGYVDIPAHPRAGDPRLLFTPGFGGCALVADRLNETTIRVRHVVGGQEDAQYNNLGSLEHGQGMMAAMEYKDYGYHEDTKGRLINNAEGTAFMQYEEEGGWSIKYQGLAKVPIIMAMNENTVGMFSKRPQLKVKASCQPGRSVVDFRSVPLSNRARTSAMSAR